MTCSLIRLLAGINAVLTEAAAGIDAVFQVIAAQN
jgi:hypothetical protein